METVETAETAQTAQTVTLPQYMYNELIEDSYKLKVFENILRGYLEQLNFHLENSKERENKLRIEVGVLKKQNRKLENDVFEARRIIKRKNSEIYIERLERKNEHRLSSVSEDYESSRILERPFI